MDLKYVILPSQLVLVLAGIVGVAGVGGGTMANLDGHTVTPQARHLESPLPYCGNCSWIYTTTQNWYDYSLGCDFEYGASKNGWLNIYTITTFQCDNGYSYNCSNTNPGGCAGPAGYQPGCPSGTCADSA